MPLPAFFPGEMPIVGGGGAPMADGGGRTSASPPVSAGDRPPALREDARGVGGALRDLASAAASIVGGPLSTQPSVSSDGMPPNPSRAPAHFQSQSPSAGGVSAADMAATLQRSSQYLPAHSGGLPPTQFSQHHQHVLSPNGVGQPHSATQSLYGGQGGGPQIVLMPGLGHHQLMYQHGGAHSGGLANMTSLQPYVAPIFPPFSHISRRPPNSSVLSCLLIWVS